MRREAATMETLLDPEEYIESLRVGALFTDGQVDEIGDYDGAALYEVNTSHFVIVGCTEHKHRGAAALRQELIPGHWVIFARVRNDAEGYMADHWGPPWT